MSDEEPIYRESALEHIKKANRLDQAVSVVSAKAWVILSAILFFILFALIWGFFGTITTTVRGTGILLEKNGSIYVAEGPSGANRLIKIMVKPGELVKKNQTIAMLSNPVLAKKIELKKAYLVDLNSRETALETKIQGLIKRRKNYSEIQEKMLAERVDKGRSWVEGLTELLRVKQESREKGLETQEGLVRTLQDYQIMSSTIEGLKLQIMQQQITLNDYIETWEERLRVLRNKILDEQYALSNLEAEYRAIRLIKSPVDGEVLNLQSTIGETIKHGDEIALIAARGKGMEGVVYFSSSESKYIKVGANALVSPSHVKREEFGSIKALVTQVSTYPVTHEEIVAKLHNAELAKQFLQQAKVPISVRVALIPDAHNFSGYAWTSSHGPKSKITEGTYVEVRVQVKQEKPIALILPFFKKILEA
ncbi:MAG: NHLP bacteriocin system secretion protein [Gammaproteobacteria bacterium]